VTVSVFEVIYDDGLVWEAEPSTKQDNVDSEPVLVRMPAHRYTEEALKKKLEGAVKMKLLVGKDGLVKNVMVLKGLPDGLNEQALEAAYNALFKPAVRGGLPIEYWVLCELDFKLSNTGRFERIWPFGGSFNPKSVMRTSSIYLF
jgi:TonB family protein